VKRSVKHGTYKKFICANTQQGLSGSATVLLERIQYGVIGFSSTRSQKKIIITFSWRAAWCRWDAG